METPAQWRFDTLDARGGLAFATWRTGVSLEGQAGQADSACIFVGAPSFRPQRVANRAIALAAGRGAFQTGLFIGGAEATFPTAAAVAEFVRRAYIRGSAGDGSDGGGGDTPPPRPEDGPDLPNRPEGMKEENKTDGLSLHMEVREAVRRFADTASRLSMGQAEAFTWPSYDASRNYGDGVEILASASLDLLHEMLSRMPKQGDPRAMMLWQRDARRLGAVLTQIDLWPVLLTEPFQPYLSRLIESVAVQVLGLPFQNQGQQFHNDRFLEALIYVLFLGGPDLDDHALWYWVENTSGFRGEYHPWLPASGQATSLDLSRIPLPRKLDHIVYNDLRGRASVLHAMSVFVGEPSLAATNPKLFEIVVLAATLLVTLPESQGSRGLQRWRTRGGISNIARMRLTFNAGNAWNWLREQLPNHVFPKALESAIAQTADLRYRG